MVSTLLLIGCSPSKTTTTVAKTTAATTTTARNPLLVIITMQLGGLILAEAGLSFLGIGIKPPGAAWGSMVNDGYKYLIRNPVLSFAPGFCIMAVVFAFNMVGDGLRDALDPGLRGLL